MGDSIMLANTLALDLRDLATGDDGNTPTDAADSFQGLLGWKPIAKHPMTFEEYLELADDPEDDAPTSWLPVAGTTSIARGPEAIEQAVLDWRIEALGDRPRDHMARDLLHAGLLADPRTTKYHGLTTNPPDWVERRVAHLEPRFRRPAIQHTVLDAMHRHHLGRLWADLEGRDGRVDPEWFVNGEDRGLLLSLAACRPVGALLTWQGTAGRTHDFTCGYARACPWCHARKVVDLYDRLVAGPCRPGRLKGKFLVRVGLKIQGDDLRSNEGFAEFARARGHVVTRHGNRWQFGGLLRRRDHLYAADVRTVRDFLTVMLGRITARLGIAGGIVTYKVGPQLSRDEINWDPFDYRHELDIVGELDGPGRVEPFQRIMRIGTGECPMIYNQSNYATGIRADLAEGGDPSALRLLLAGPSYRPEAARRSIWTNGASPHHDSGKGGVLRWPPWFLADPRQWWPHFHATRRFRLYSPFGTWKEELARARAGDREAQPAVLADRSRRNQAEALHRRQKLLKVARAVGKGLGHRKLRAAMIDAGHDASERDARWWAERIG